MTHIVASHQGVGDVLVSLLGDLSGCPSHTVNGCYSDHDKGQKFKVNTVYFAFLLEVLLWKEINTTLYHFCTQTYKT